MVSSALRLARAPSFVRLTAVLLLASACALSPVAADDNEVVTAPPVLVSTTAGGPSWETIPELEAAAEKGDPVASFQYAQLLEEGDGTLAADPQRALALYETAAAAGHGEAIFRLGKIHHDGLLDVTRDLPRAFTLYRRAAMAEIPEGTYNVGAMLVSGRGAKRDYVEGLAWLLLAAEQGTDPGSIDQVKHRLRGRPDMIAAAEKRLLVLKTELAAPVKTPDTVNAVPPQPAKPAPPVFVRPSTPAPTIRPEITRPTLPGLIPDRPILSSPGISIPPPPPPPPVAKPADDEPAT